MKTLVAIRGHASASQIVRLLCPFYRKAGVDLVGLDGSDSIIQEWPSCFRAVVAVSVEKANPHPSWLVNAVEMLLSSLYDAFLLTEHDSIFLSKIPDPPKAFGAFIAGYCPERWNCGNGPFLHPPFYATRETWTQWLSAASSLLKTGNTGNGTPDVFTALACERANLAIENLVGTWSTNGLDMRCASKLMQARAQASAGVWHLHGIKRQDHLDYILGSTDQFPADVIME